MLTVGKLSPFLRGNILLKTNAVAYYTKVFQSLHHYSIKFLFYQKQALKNVNYLNSNIYSYLKTSGGLQNSTYSTPLQENNYLELQQLSNNTGVEKMNNIQIQIRTFIDCMQYLGSACGTLGMHAVPWECMQYHGSACSTMGVHAIPWQCMQYLGSA